MVIALDYLPRGYDPEWAMNILMLNNMTVKQNMTVKNKELVLH